MHDLRKKSMVLVVLLLICLLAVTGCKSEKDKVLESEYYKKLQTQKKKLEKENKKLKGKIEKQNELSGDEKRVADYLKKIARDHLIKLEVSHADDPETGIFIDKEPAYKLAVIIAQRADITDKYTPEKLAKKFVCRYKYILYDENNAVYEIAVYDGDYVVFSDLPNNVFYSYNASALGDAFLRYRIDYPDSKLFHRLADSPLIITGKGSIAENSSAIAMATAINKMEKTKISEKDAVKIWKKAAKEKKTKYSKPKGAVYSFYHHGNSMTLTLYGEVISIENMDGKVTWYQAQKEDITAVKKLFTKL